MLQRVISGGQTGADMAGLIAAANADIATGGTAPKNYMTEDGVNLELRDIYGLIDIGTYKSRTIKNVCDSDGTIAFIVHNGRGGTSKTIGYGKYGKWCDYYESNIDGFKPVLVIDNNDMELVHITKTVAKIVNWLIDNKITVVNIAGHRKTTAFQKPFYPTAPYDYQQRVIDILTNVFNKIK